MPTKKISRFAKGNANINPRLFGDFFHGVDMGVRDILFASYNLLNLQLPGQATYGDTDVRHLRKLAQLKSMEPAAGEAAVMLATSE